MAGDRTDIQALCARIATVLKPRMEALGWVDVRYWQDEHLIDAKHRHTWHASGKSPAGESMATDMPSFGPDGALYHLYQRALEIGESGVE